ncbi:MAG: biopolymer transporter ExbD [Crocinitomicaceae bacterium]|nr:biopolymer transporter ExbD [Crocinitomicaceae bacterium]
MARRELPEINAGSMADIAFLLLIFFLVTTTMDRDQAYIRNIPKNIEVITEPDPVEKRNILAIQANGENQLMVRGVLVNEPDDISDLVIEFYRTNEASNDPTNDFPMYSRVSMAAINAAIDVAYEDAEATQDLTNTTQDIKDFKWRIVTEWEKKQAALRLLGKNELPEIHVQAHIRIEVMSETEYYLFAKIQSELEEAIYTLRDDAAKEIFGESYGTIKKRYDMDKKEDKKQDKPKLDLLKILYPDRFIEVTPS